jgi:hypothetical protein
MANSCSRQSSRIAWHPTVVAFRPLNQKSSFQKFNHNHPAALLAVAAVNDMKQFILKYKKPIIITLSVIALQLIFGFDPKFTLINIIWLFV